MIYEIAEITIKAGSQQAFEEAVAEACPQFKAAEGCHSFKLEQGIESPESYRLVIGWETVDHHMVDFRESEGFQIWRNLVSSYFTAPPSVSHVNVVYQGF